VTPARALLLLGLAALAVAYWLIGARGFPAADVLLGIGIGVLVWWPVLVFGGRGR
jgi:hypothetical protein